ncbi:triose-phosphate isomerase [soil metagenome]
MKRMIVAGNWKMHTTTSEAATLALAVLAHKDLQGGMAQGVEVVLCPPFTSLQSVVASTATSSVRIGAQDCHHEQKGAFTGDVSASMIRAIGCSHVIVGHSERRRYHHERDELIAQKILAALSEGLVPIVCCGETLEERESGATTSVIGKQLHTLVQIVGAEQMQRCIVAYEPVWAIGTGLAATPEQAQEVHAFIATQLSEQNVTIPILYGGSVTAENAATLFACTDVYGALVGGASLKADAFAGIVAAAGEQAR